MPQRQCARTVSRGAGAAPNTARDITYSGMRSNKGLAHHISSAASHTLSSAQPTALRMTKIGNVTHSHGRQAAERLRTQWDCVVTAEEAGCYKPDPRPYRQALAALGVTPGEAAFVAGSGYDLFGTSAVGLRTYWHNRVGLARPDGAPPAALERPTLDDLLPWLEGRLS